MNIEALRRTQLSIMDETKPFDMDQWSRCIAGHALMANGIDLWMRPIASEATFILGLTSDQAGELFSGWADRRRAVQRIDDLIASEAHVRAAKAPGRRLNSAETVEAVETEAVEEFALAGV